MSGVGDAVMAAIYRSAEVARRRSLQPLRGLLPHVVRYRKMVAGAIASLMLAAAMTLTLPLAVGRMIDRGFSASESSLVTNYFIVLGAIAAVLASACRYYFVVTLGERVVADIRRDVFSHVTKLSPAVFRYGAINRSDANLAFFLTSIGLKRKAN
jgi:ATP-binding cassette, subfamily B, bacterial